MPPTLYSTLSAAQGIARSLSFGILLPETTQIPYVPFFSLSRAASISSTACWACALNARSLSRSTAKVSPSPPSSPKSTSPGSRPSIKESASALKD